LTSLRAPSHPAKDPREDALEQRLDAWRASDRERETRTRPRVTTIALLVVVIVGAVFFWAVTRG
jgi:hypothetical protein